MNTMTIRVGVEGGRLPVLRRARDLGAPLLISANSLWDNKRRRFRGYQRYSNFDVALDSGGFVAMKRYGGYRWTIDQYVALAGTMKPTWWAQMDFCCEPEIAKDSTAVWKRIDMTAEHLRQCQAVAKTKGVPAPLLVLQGWKPTDYCQGPIYEQDYKWPDLVGIGSVCRRNVNGPTGILAVVAALDWRLPPNVRFHLFGVKSQAIARLVKEFPHRIASMDSMAWNMQARWDAFNGKITCDNELRASAMGNWYVRQLFLSKQPLITNEQLLLLMSGAAAQTKGKNE